MPFALLLTESMQCQRAQKTALQLHPLHNRTLKRSRQVLTEWDDTVRTVMVEKAIVHKDKTITFIFYNGSKVRVGA